MDLFKPTPANSCPLTPLAFLERAATVYGECTSLVYNCTTYTWSETHRRCLQLASSISVLGIKMGDVVSVVAPNIPAMYELQFAVPMAGAVLNNINTRLDARTISILLHHGESKLVFVDYFWSPLVLEAISLFPPNVKPPILVLITDDVDVSSSLTVDFHATYEGMLERSDPEFKWVRPKTEWDPMTLNYTSGTTSSPKGVPLVGPIFASVNSTLQLFLTRFEDTSVTHMCGAPVVLNMLANSPAAKPLQNPVHFLTGGAPPPAAVLLRTESLGFVVSHGYGMTEVAGVVVSCAWKPQWNRLPATERAKLKARQGVRTIGMSEVDVVDPTSGVSVKRDGLTLGEIVLRGGCLMLGYLKDPEGTSKCMRENGWLYTGDVGVMYRDGYLEIKDRSKDIIISGGENVSSVEVESVLYSNPVVNEAAVVARPDEFWGETPCAFMSLKMGTTEKTKEIDIIEFCRDRLPHYMVPKTVVFMEELPKTSTGKIRKFVLRQTAKAMGSLPASRM
ncbi:hypothetical protein F0562_006739 [Nyssa sinensis]|uniref:Uncharacterized protein n=1 Tax=Nyssa sinensis TaxID=561372 RepID=A0A5J5APE5_9ASTE|nr:hypothetical protein F0562_006739 [Nyssa sinensis]